eukprot:scaffold67359_cov30-Tisochrysis_lutea.AAC.2
MRVSRRPSTCRSSSGSSSYGKACVAGSKSCRLPSRKRAVFRSLRYASKNEAVREDGAVRRDAVDGDRCEERGLEPSAVLIRALEIQVSGVAQPLTRRGDACPRGARVKPHVHRVGALTVPMRLGCVWFGQQIGLIRGPPDVSAVLGHESLDVGQRLGIEKRLVGLAVVEDRDGHAPRALARDAPVRARLCHRGDTVLTDGGEPACLLDGCERLLAEAVDRGEPLRGSSEYGRLLGAPVVRVLVLVRLLRDKRARRAQRVDDRDVALAEHALPLELGARLGRESTCVIHRREQLEPVLEPRLVVLLPVAGRLAAHDDLRGATSEWVGVFGTSEFGPLERAEHLKLRPLGQPLNPPERLVPDERILEVGIDGDGKVGRDCPRRGGPDGYADGRPVRRVRRQARCRLRHLKANVDRSRRMLRRVLELGLGECRA